MKIILSEFKKGINPYGIPYEKMIKGKQVIVDIPINHNGECMEVEGTISQELWLEGGIPTLQINMSKQNTHKETHSFSKGLYAVYPEKIKKIF